MPYFTTAPINMLTYMCISGYTNINLDFRHDFFLCLLVCVLLCVCILIGAYT